MKLNRGIYHVTDGSKRNKVGSTRNWEHRWRDYVTHNSTISFKEFVCTRKKTKHRLERECQKEIEELGGVFIVNHGVKTEWFEFPGEFSLSMLKCCKGRKIYTLD